MTEQITSRQNPLVKHLRSLASDRTYRSAAGEYLCEGEKMLGEALKWAAPLRTVVCTEHTELPAGIGADVRVCMVPDALLDYISPMKSSPGVLFTCAVRTCEPAAPGRCLVLETIQDPGNLGTILRTANALGMDSVILTGDCADVYNPKTLRAGMGAHFRQTFYRMSRPEMRSYLTRYDLRLYGAALGPGSTDVRKVDLHHAAVAIGSEGQGLSDELLSLCDGRIIIPMNEQCESLNAGIAAAILMWELRRTEEQHGGT